MQGEEPLNLYPTVEGDDCTPVPHSLLKRAGRGRPYSLVLHLDSICVSK